MRGGGEGWDEVIGGAIPPALPMPTPGLGLGIPQAPRPWDPPGRRIPPLGDTPRPQDPPGLRIPPREASPTSMLRTASLSKLHGQFSQFVVRRAS